MNNSNLGLENIGNLSELLGNAEVSSGTPLRLPLASIKEDPDQPRKEFDEGKIQELANSIQERGVKTPISVRQSSEEGVYVINHGARRYRASLLAGLSEIPAYIDQDYSLIDQAVENIQRDNLTPREIADVIGRLLAEGMKKGQIAEKMGKSPAFVTQHANLLDLPEPLANAFNSGKVSDLTVINDLNALYKKEPEAVEDLLSNED
ncbi:ParB/RepB/Spo0J family partition protein, partial [Neisseria gonorrhoeae]